MEKGSQIFVQLLLQKLCLRTFKIAQSGHTGIYYVQVVFTAKNRQPWPNFVYFQFSANFLTF